MSRITPFKLSPDTLRLLQVLEATTDDAIRDSAIAELAAKPDTDSARVLLEAFERSMWRDIKIRIIRALGSVNQQRSTERLMAIALQQEDLGLAAEAMLALGQTDRPDAGEFLLNIIVDPMHPLCREAIIALSNLTMFPCESQLLVILSKKDGEVPTAILQYAVIALARRGDCRCWPAIERFLDNREWQTDGSLFNTMLIAAGQLGNHATLPKLSSIDTRYRFFAHQLKLTAMEHIHLKNERRIEDAISALLTATDRDTQRDALQTLYEFPRERLREAIELFASEASAAQKGLARLALVAADTLAEDLAFLKSAWHHLSVNQICAIVRMHMQLDSKVCHATLINELTQEQILQIYQNVYFPTAIHYLTDLAGASDALENDRVQAINALVGQAQMSAGQSAVLEQCSAKLMQLINQEKSERVRARSIRALGQLGAASDAVLTTLGTLLRSRDVASPSIYRALGSVGNERAATVICRRLQTIKNRDDLQLEIEHSLSALANCGAIEQPLQLADINSHVLERMRLSVLKILTTNRADGMAPFVLAALRQEDFQTRMLAIAAAKRNHDEAVWLELFSLLDATNHCLRERALDSICGGGGPAEHRELLSLLTPDRCSKQTALKAYRTLTPSDIQSYAPHLQIIDAYLQTGRGVYADPEVISAAINLRDNLVLSIVIPASGTSTADATSRHHAADTTLLRDLAAFQSYSETVKSVLRNAELTFRHPDLFDERVDKSTIVVEYVKSIDLWLQERIGASIFLEQNHARMSKMQSRIVQLQLDEGSQSNAALIRDLQCEQHFSPDEFPGHKLFTLAKSISSGKIVYDQYKTIDGLRAWALLLLLFARKFKFRGGEVAPLFTVQDASNSLVSSIAADMNRLQDLRNQAAHRGTMLQSSQLTYIRDLSLQVLKKLAMVF